MEKVISKKKNNIKQVKAFIAGAEFAIITIRENMSGSALRMFDLHSYQTEDLLKQIKKLNKIK